MIAVIMAGDNSSAYAIAQAPPAGAVCGPGPQPAFCSAVRGGRAEGLAGAEPLRGHGTAWDGGDINRSLRRRACK